jgi:hypothetical protein
LRGSNTPGGPELVVEDLVHVGVVLAEVASRIAQVVEEIRTDPVASNTPCVPFGVAFKDGFGAPADLIDIVDFPRAVMEEVDRRSLDNQVVVVGGAAHEEGEAFDFVADLEPNALLEELSGGFRISRSDRHVPLRYEPERGVVLDCLGNVGDSDGDVG